MARPTACGWCSQARPSTRSATKATQRAQPRARAPVSRTWPATASLAVPTATTPTPTTSTSRCGPSRPARPIRARRRRSSSTRSTTTRSAPTQPSSSSSRTRLPCAVNLDPYVVELVNGSGGAVYGTFDLPAVSLAGGDYYVICANATTVPNCDLDVDPNTDRIQNGSPDGIRLLLAGATVDALSYEGDTLGSTEGTGTTAADSNSEGGIGLSRCADGADTDNNNADFALKAITPGATNACEPPPPDPVGNCGEAATRIHDVQGSGAATPLANTRSRSRASSSPTSRAPASSTATTSRKKQRTPTPTRRPPRASSSSAAPASTTSAPATSCAFAEPPARASP